MLPDFLISVSGLWDELIAVDTGSVDVTAELLRRTGAKVLHHPWTHDFAVARNHSLDSARGDWVLVLDADERCSPEFVTQARALLGRADVGAATVLMRNVRGAGHVHETRLLRMFRRNDAVRFRHAIHEDVSESLWPVLAASGQQLVHLLRSGSTLGLCAFCGCGAWQKKRDVTILDSCLERDPDDLYLHFKRLEQARVWNDEALWLRAAKSAHDAVLRAPCAAMGPWAGEFVVMVVLGLHPDDAQVALAVLDALAQSLSDSAAVRHCRGELLERSGHLAQAAAAFEQALQSRAPLVNQQLVGVLPLMGLVRIAIATGDLLRARDFLQRALQLEPADPEALFACQILLRDGLGIR